MIDHQDIERQAATWIAQRDAGKWNEQLQAGLDTWLSASTANRVAFLRLDAAWKTSANAAPVPAPAARTAQSAGSAWRWRIAAALLLTAGGAAFFALNGYAPATVVATAVGGSQVMSLPDGSEVALNTATTVRAKVNERERKVWLDQGEAYFAVAHDASHPFVVVAGDSRITVLGTKFLVRTQDGKTEIDVLEGRVRVEPITSAAGKNALILTANQRVIAVPGKLIRSSQNNVQLENALSWRERKLVFDQVSLEHAADEFNRYNTTKLLIVDAEARKVVIGGRFDIDNVQGFARLLRQGFGLQVTEAPGQIVVSAGERRAP
jgi:transmembrane sensor